MSWFAPAAGLSEKAEGVLQEMADSGASEGAGVADILNTIAMNSAEQAEDEHLVSCAEEVRGWAEHFISEMKKGGE